MEEFRPNSDKSREKAKEKSQISPIVEKGDVQIEKKSEFRKILEAFFPGGGEDIKRTIFEDVLIPYLKKMGLGMVQTLLYGNDDVGYDDDDPRGRSRDRSSYTRYYDNSSRKRSKKSNDHVDFGNLFFYSRAKAEMILDQMNERIDDCDSINIRELCEFLGSDDYSYTDENYGWVSLRGARISRIRDGFRLGLPDPERL